MKSSIIWSLMELCISPLSANFTKWPNTLKQFANKLSERVWPFCGIGAERVKHLACFSVAKIIPVMFS